MNDASVFNSWSSHVTGAGDDEQQWRALSFHVLLTLAEALPITDLKQPLSLL
jgi:hypothetical protein